MKPGFFVLLFALSLSTYAQEKKPAPTLKGILLEQLRTTHDKAEWFVPANTAVEGLTQSRLVGPTARETTPSAN